MPRPLSDGERAASQIGLDFLARGPEGIWSHLSSASPLRAIGKADALKEIEVRTGPSEGARWELSTVVPSLQNRVAVFRIAFPSGIDETLIMNLVKESGEYKIESLIISAEPSIFALEKPRKKAESGTPTAFPWRDLISFLGLAAAMLALTAILARRTHRGAASIAFLAAIAIALAAFALALKRDDRFQKDAAQASKAKPGATQSMTRLASLLPMRRAMVAGNDDSRFPHVSPSADEAQRNVAHLWKAQDAFQRMDVGSARKEIEAFPSPSDLPLAEILRARLAFLDSKEVAAVMDYEHAINLGPGYDDLWFEAADALQTLGFEDRSRSYLERLRRMGSRKAQVYYALSGLAAVRSDLPSSEKELRRGFALKPVSRSAVVSAGVFCELVRKPEVGTFLQLSAANEPMITSPRLSANPLMMPAGFSAHVIGDYLDLRSGSKVLSVPGGACLAPAGSETTDAATWDEMEETTALNDFSQLIKVSSKPSVFGQPSMRVRFEQTAAALANHNRWNDLVHLTDAISPKLENVPVDLFFLRGSALRRINHTQEARELYLSLAANHTIDRKSDPAALAELGEMLASVDLFDPAIRVMQRASAKRNMPYLDDRIRQIETNKRLASRYSTSTTPHFEIHYPADGVDAFFISRLGQIMEAEQARLTGYIPLQNLRPVTINVISWEEFRATYTGTDHILGFYDGRITIPFAGVSMFVPEIVAIMSHELAHAMIAQLTADQAPRWFQEGMAQRIESIHFQQNALNMYEDDKLLSVALLDATLKGSPDPDMIKEAYIEAQTVIRFLEARFGADGPKRMMAAFAGGATTAEAIKSVSGLSIGAFDQQLRQWGRARVILFVNDSVVRYDGKEQTIRAHDGTELKKHEGATPIPASLMKTRTQ
ncbi:MAG TPA: hypothetical protein VHL58_17520 [Thermoanaerobaculia bacterium]|nr:hypothetical protein [Thermoanaerobaculia bacterium]